MSPLRRMRSEFGPSILSRLSEDEVPLPCDVVVGLDLDLVVVVLVLTKSFLTSLS